ncbi:ABC transporter permease [Bacillus sp. A015]
MNNKETERIKAAPLRPNPNIDIANNLFIETLPDSQFGTSYYCTHPQSIENVNEIEKVATFNMKTSVRYKDKRSNIMQFSTMTDSIKEVNLEVGELPVDNEVLLTPSVAKALTSEEDYKSLVGKKVNIYVNENDSENKPVIIEKQLIVSGVYSAEAMGMLGMTSAYVPYKTLENAYADNHLDLRPTQINVFANEKEQVEGMKSTFKLKHHPIFLFTTFQ